MTSNHLPNTTGPTESWTTICTKPDTEYIIPEDLLKNLNSLETSIYLTLLNSKRPIPASYITKKINEQLDIEHNKKEVGDCLYDVFLPYLDHNTNVIPSLWSLKKISKQKMFEPKIYEKEKITHEFKNTYDILANEEM